METLKKAWVVAVDMGYGHQRAAYPLRHLSPTGKVMIANNYPGIPKGDYNIWNGTQKLYETISRVKSIPIIGRWIFGLMDYLQRIPYFYPRRDLSRPVMQVEAIYKWIAKGWGKDLVRQLNCEKIPLITTFFTIAFMAEEHGFKNDIYVVICDSDCSRAWVAEKPWKSKIRYLAPCRRVVERLKEYGVKENRIFLTGFPLPEENLGGGHLNDLRRDVAERIINLDPERHYRDKYFETVKQFLKGVEHLKTHRPLTVTFAVGGAGAQRQIAVDILKSLKKKLLMDKVNLNLVAGSRDDVYSFFRDYITKFKLNRVFGKNLNIIYDPDKEVYFKKFNEALRVTDVLWTKPSELVFYSALGLPIIVAPPVGSQEVFNRIWLKTVGAGISQNDPRYTHEWLFDWVKSGWLAEAAMSGFLDGRQFGVRNIMDVVFNGVKEPAKDDSLLY